MTNVNLWINKDVQFIKCSTETGSSMSYSTSLACAINLDDKVVYNVGFLWVALAGRWDVFLSWR